MISKFVTLPLLIAAGVVAHPTVVRLRRDTPTLSQWQGSGLESFWTYRVRYQSLDCADQAGSDFYNSCCYPLQAGQSASAECTPSSLSCSSSGPFGTTTTVTTPAVSNPPSDNGATTQSDDNDDSEYCDDDGDYEDDAYTPPATDNTSNNQASTDNSGSNDNSGNTGTTPDNSGSTGWTDPNSGSTGWTDPNSGGGGVNTGGHGTWFYQGGNPGACGNYHQDSDLIGAIDQAWYGDLGQQSQYCGRYVQVTNTDNGKSVTIQVADVCPTCDNANSFDLSLGAFSAIADLGQGLIPISWSFV